MSTDDRNIVDLLTCRALQNAGEQGQAANGRSQNVFEARAVKGRPFKYTGSLKTGLEVFFPNSPSLKVSAERIRLIREEVDAHRGSVRMGACLKPLVADSVGEAIYCKHKLTPIFRHSAHGIGRMLLNEKRGPKLAGRTKAPDNQMTRRTAKARLNRHVWEGLAALVATALFPWQHQNGGATCPASGERQAEVSTDWLAIMSMGWLQRSGAERSWHGELYEGGCQFHLLLDESEDGEVLSGACRVIYRKSSRSCLSVFSKEARSEAKKNGEGPPSTFKLIRR